MKVLQVTTHMKIGGIARYITGLCGALKERGIDTIVASTGGGMESVLDANDIRHIRLNINTKSELNPKVLFSAIKLSKIIKGQGVGIIHAHSRVSQVAASLASRLTGVPYVTTCHGFFKKRMRGIFDTWGSKVIAISDNVKSHLKKDLGVADDRIVVIYNGVDPKSFSKEYADDEKTYIKRALGLNGGPVIGTIGRLSPVKGHEYLIMAMKEVVSKKKEAQALIVGDGPEEGYLKNMAESLGLENAVRFTKSDINIHRLLSIMDIFVFPSVKEGLGLALLEAMASARPCIASRVGGITDIIKENSNGMLFPVGDVAVLAKDILLLLDDTDLSRRMGRKARDVVSERFSLDLMADKTVKLYEEILKI